MLMTKALRKQIPKLGEQANVKDPIVYAKFFTPDSNWTWYILEFDGVDQMFAYVKGFHNELGYVSLKELSSVRGPMGLYVERDRYFKPTSLSKIKSGEVY